MRATACLGRRARRRSWSGARPFSPSPAVAPQPDEVLEIVGVDAQCAFVRARAWRRSAASGEALAYEWAMLYRVEDGQITYGADMLDAEAQAFWGRVLAP